MLCLILNSIRESERTTLRSFQQIEEETPNLCHSRGRGGRGRWGCGRKGGAGTASFQAVHAAQNVPFCPLCNSPLGWARAGSRPPADRLPTCHPLPLPRSRHSLGQTRHAKDQVTFPSLLYRTGVFKTGRFRGILLINGISQCTSRINIRQNRANQGASVGSANLLTTSKKYTDAEST